MPPVFCSCALLCSLASAAVFAQECAFRVDPPRYLHAQRASREAVYERTRKFSEAARFTAAQAGEALAIPRRNFIDEEIFGKLQRMQVPTARSASDQEFLRRAFLDITGRIPSSQDVRNFVNDTTGDKRERLIDKLLAAPEFSDKWAVWFGDLVGMRDGLSTSNRRPQIEGRNWFDAWVREQIQHNRPISEIVYKTLTSGGNNYFSENAPANFIVLGSAAMGPAQDTYDLITVKSVTAYLGLGHYDCLMCHSGRNHLEALTVWGTRTTRSDAHRMAAHFARTRLNGVREARQFESPLYNSTEIVDSPGGTYDLNTTFGNRPPRRPYGTERNLTPEYRDGTPAGGSWRQAFAEKLIADPLFGVNFANRIWKEFFGIGLIDPVDGIDPDRLDPANPPAAPWTLQPSHPELLRRLAKHFVDSGTSLRELIRVIATSSAYQLSSTYEGEWKSEYVPLFARRYPRRIQAEEVHDAIVAATGVRPSYTWPLINGQTVERGTPLPQSAPVSWAMQLPDPTEPRNNGNVRNFLAAFTRGDRDTAKRSQEGSILQQLALMNDNAVVLQRIRIANSPRLRELAAMEDNRALIVELWLTFLSRTPTEAELGRAMEHLSGAATRSSAIEDLAWAAVNKVEFLFSY